MFNHINSLHLKNWYIIPFLFISYLVIAQPNSAIARLDTINSDQEKLDYLGKTILAQLYSNPENIAVYARLYDSISKIEVSPENTADALNYLGIAHYVAQEYDLAIEFYLQAARKLEIGTQSKKLSRIYNNIAACYNIRDDFENTEKYFLKSLNMATEIKDAPWIANLNNNLSVLYMNNKMYDKANMMIENALGYYEEKKDSLWMGITYMNYGNSKIYTEEFDTAISYYDRSKELIKYEQFPLIYAVSETGKGTALTKQKKYAEALPHLIEGLKIGKEIKHVEQMMESYNALADYYSETEDYNNAYRLAMESQKLKDSVLTATQDQNMADALTKFETEKKDTQLKLLALESEKDAQEKQLYLFLALAGLLVAGLIGFFLYKNRKKNTLLASQKKMLEATVDEKNVLLKETHHRVKNSFQIVSSLLYLQAENIEDKEAKLAMKEAQNRVRSMVLIHQKLYSKDQLVGINTKEYFEDLTRDVFESHQFKNNAIQHALDVAPIVLDIESITPLGLILNELITNVIKHAFDPVTETSSMQISLKKEGEHLLLEVVDNGIGMPSAIKESSFGIQLIKALAKKLKATLNFDPNHDGGTRARLEIRRFTEL